MSSNAFHSMGCMQDTWYVARSVGGIYIFTWAIPHIHLQEETVQRVNTIKHLRSSLSDEGELDAELTHRVQNGWKNWKRMCGVFGEGNEREDPCGKLYRKRVRPALDERGGDIEEGTGKEIGGRRNTNEPIDVCSYKARQDKE